MKKQCTDSGIRAVSEPTLRRLPVYLRVLRRLDALGREWVSCTRLAEHLDRDPTQIRKDLSVTGVAGRRKVGYRVPEVIGAIEHFLGWDNRTDAFLVGAGSLGRALMGFGGFEQHGLRIVAAFDTAPEVVGTDIRDRPVFPLEKLPDLARRMHVAMGIITTPPAAAQSVSDLMILSGIRAIWNFAPVHLVVRPDVLVENEDLSAGLAVLSQRLAARTNHRTEV